MPRKLEEEEKMGLRERIAELNEEMGRINEEVEACTKRLHETQPVAFAVIIDSKAMPAAEKCAIFPLADSLGWTAFSLRVYYVRRERSLQVSRYNGTMTLEGKPGSQVVLVPLGQLDLLGNRFRVGVFSTKEEAEACASDPTNKKYQ